MNNYNTMIAYVKNALEIAEAEERVAQEREERLYNTALEVYRNLEALEADYSKNPDDEDLTQLLDAAYNNYDIAYNMHKEADEYLEEVVDFKDTLKGLIRRIEW